MAKTLLIVALLATAHPVPRDTHDRHIQLRLTVNQDSLRIDLDFRVEIDEFTVIQQDMAPFRDEVDPASFSKRPLEYYGEFTKRYADIYANHLLLKLDGKPIELKCIQHVPSLKDEKGEPLGHLRGQFQYTATVPLGPGEHRLTFEEQNYLDQEGQIFMALASSGGLRFLEQQVPDGKLNEIAPLDRTIDYDRKLRNLSVRFERDGESAKVEPKATDTKPRETKNDEEGFLKLFREVRENGTSFWLAMIFFAGFGAAHALTPGHGKTLVAAYLVGQRGTIWHACVLGMVTTVTHTGVVLLLAALLYVWEPARDIIQQGLGLAMGLTVMCLGVWLLLQRLAGRADHFHVGAGHHHHGQGHGHHHEPPADGGRLRWAGIIILGITGGLIPCWDAIVILLACVGSSEMWFALPALLAFSAGLAATLVLIGVLVVKFRDFAGSRWGQGRIIHSLPIVSALLVTAIGFWLCYESVHP